MKGIIFSEENFNLTVQGKKTMTRRIVKSRTGFFNACSKNGIVTDIWQCDDNGWNGENLIPVKPRYNVGETVYLKEPYAYAPIIEEQKNIYPHDDFIYRYGNEYISIKWRNKLFMPESAARYFIKITNVRAERLQDISEEDCIKEGIKVGRCGNESNWMKAYYMPGDNQPYISARSAYEELINKINGKGTWESNPFVWVYNYELTNLE